MAREKAVRTEISSTKKELKTPLVNEYIKLSNPAEGKTCPINLTGKTHSLSPLRKTDNTP